MSPPQAKVAALLSSPDDIEAQFYEALQSGDIAKLMAVWSDDDDVVCVHPGGPRVLGHAAVRATFEEIFSRGAIPVIPVASTIERRRVQLGRQRGDDAPAEAGIALQLGEDGVFRDVQHQRVGQRARGNDVGLVEEHDRLAEAAPGADDVGDALAAVRRARAQLDAAVHHRVKAGGPLALAEQELAALQLPARGRCGEPRVLRLAQPREQRQPGEELLGPDRSAHAPTLPARAGAGLTPVKAASSPRARSTRRRR